MSAMVNGCGIASRGRYQNTYPPISVSLRPAQRHELVLAMWLAMCIDQETRTLAVSGRDHRVTTCRLGRLSGTKHEHKMRQGKVLWPATGSP